MPLPGTGVQEKGNAANVGLGTTLGKLARKGRNPPKLVLWEATTTPKESCSPLGPPGLGWGLSSQGPSGASLGSGVGLSSRYSSPFPAGTLKTLRGFRVLPGDLGFLVSIISRGIGAEAPRLREASLSTHGGEEGGRWGLWGTQWHRARGTGSQQGNHHRDAVNELVAINNPAIRSPREGWGDAGLFYHQAHVTPWQTPSSLAEEEEEGMCPSPGIEKNRGKKPLTFHLQSLEPAQGLVSSRDFVKKGALPSQKLDFWAVPRGEAAGLVWSR